MNILSAGIQPRHMLAQPHPAHFARSGCHTGHALGTLLFPQSPPPLARATGGRIPSRGRKEPGRTGGENGRGEGAGEGLEESSEGKSGAAPGEPQFATF